MLAYFDVLRAKNASNNGFLESGYFIAKAVSRYF